MSASSKISGFIKNGLSIPLIRQFRESASERFGRQFATFEDLHRWSVETPEEFWHAAWDFEGIESPTPFGRVLESAEMPGARWFPGAKVNYAQHIFRHVEPASTAGEPAIIAEDESGSVEIVDWRTLKSKVASLAISLREMGIKKGDRIVAYLPNRPEAIIAFLACASIGAIWAVCAPDMGIPAILGRFQQIEPRVLIATDGVLYGGKFMDLTENTKILMQSLPSLDKLILVKSGYASSEVTEALDFNTLTRNLGLTVDEFAPDWLPFDHPLWIVYSSGTTGKPKALVHGHGGMLLASAAARLHSDLRPSYDSSNPGERFHLFSSTGWMLWNANLSGLLHGTTICIFDGSPNGTRDKPDWGLLWRFVTRNRITIFGASALFYTMCDRENLDFSTLGDLTKLRSLISTASPLPATVQRAISKRLADVGNTSIWWVNSSGGTDICGSFCTGNRELRETPGKLQCRNLGAAVEAWNEKGEAVFGEVGELVCTRPLPSMPLFLWGDPDGARYRSSYFEHFPGVWRHGDWLKIDRNGVCEIFGRSDATINRGGHRIGTSEIYSAIEDLDEVSDSLVIDVHTKSADSRLLLFIVPSGRASAPDDLVRRVCDTIRTSLSPRFVPDQVIEVSSIPRTLSSKKQELPIKRLFEGEPLERIIEPAAMANPECLLEYNKLAELFRATL